MLLHYTLFFFFNDTATTEIYTLSLHDALPISSRVRYWRTPFSVEWRTCCSWAACCGARTRVRSTRSASDGDRKSTRLNSSHSQISYAVFCLQKKKHTR